MTTEDQTLPQLPALRSKNIFTTRRASILFFSLSLCFVILLVIFSILVFAVPKSKAMTAVHHSAHQKSAPLSPTVPATSPPAPSPTPPPLPAPIEPFPTILGAQIATLEAHDRFFYRGNPNLPEVALTFDDGPSPAYTPQILEILRRYHVQATFFDIGRLVKLYPDLARQEVADGNLIGNHTWSHPYLPVLSLKQIQKQIADTSATIWQVTGTRPLFIRPPYGAVSANALTAINSFGMTTVIWDNEAQDWSIPGTQVIITRILNLAVNGAIILLHDGGGNRSQTVAALPIIIQQLQARHYRFATMEQLVAHYHLAALPPENAVTPTPTPRRGSFAHNLLWQEPDRQIVREILTVRGVCTIIWQQVPRGTDERENRAKKSQDLSQDLSKECTQNEAWGR